MSRRFRLLAVLSCLSLILSLGTAPVWAAVPPDMDVSLRAELTGDPIHGVMPSGEALFEFDSTNQRLRAELRAQVHLPEGTELQIFFNGYDTGKRVVLDPNGETEVIFQRQGGTPSHLVKAGDLLELRCTDVVVLAGRYQA